MIFNKVLEKIDDGRLGGNEGIPMGFPRLSQVIPNIQKSRYITIVGSSGSGKSSWLDTAYIFNPLDWYLENKDNTDIKLKINYFSMEISEDRVISKQIARKIFKDYNLILDVNYILSYGRNRLSQEHYELVIKYRDYFDCISDYLKIYDADGHNPEGIRQRLMDYAKDHGSFHKDENNRFFYTENDEKLYTINAIDHAKIVPRERGFTVKENIDKVSEHLTWFRNKCNFTNILLTQANRNLGNIDRRKLDGDDLTMSLDDISDSSNVGNDVDLAVGILDPNKHKIVNYRGYDISKLQNRSRFINILKNRDGEADKSLGLLFLGENGFFKELPKSGDMTDLIYERIKNL